MHSFGTNKGVRLILDRVKLAWECNLKTFQIISCSVFWKAINSLCVKKSMDNANKKLKELNKILECMPATR